MSQPTWDRVKTLFHEAAALPVDERAALLDRACADDVRLRAEVEALLASHDEMKAVQPQTVTESDAATARVEGPGSTVGRYKLLQQIGEGGFGTVYMAEQEQPVRRRVALKIIKLGMDTKQVIARFEAERQALALMDHPNIAKVLDAGATDTGRPYFVMELVRGVPITEYCDRNRLGPRQRIELFLAVCGAVQHAHQKGVIHRDIKPTNVMVTLHDGTPVPKIIDFGIAKATNQRLTERTLFTEYNQFIGTPAYMSPEQAEMSGLDVDTRSDIYSLGVLLYELLTGTTPLDSRRLGEVAYSEIQRLIREEEPPRPSVRISTLGQAATTAAEQRRTDLHGLTRLLRGDLDWVVMKALEKDRTRRYETANAMREDLRRYLDSEPVAASPPGALYRMRKFVRRNRVAVAVASVVVLALTSGLVLAGTGLLRAQREAEAAQQINAFFSDMLASVDPRHLREYSGLTAEREGGASDGGERAHDVSVADMMLRARDGIEAGFRGKPALEATARETIGLSLLGLGRPREASEELEAAAEIRRRELGPDHPDTLRSELQYAMSLNESGRAPASIELLRELREKMVRAHGEDDPRTLQASNLYGFALMSNGEHATSDEIFEATLARQREILGPDHRDTIETAMNWSCSLNWRGRGARGEELMRPVYETALRTYGADDVQVLSAGNELAWTLMQQRDRRCEEAADLLRRGIEGHTRILGQAHPFTNTAKMGLGRCLPDSSEEKLRVWSESLEGLRASEGKATPSVFIVSRDLAQLLLRHGRTEEGLHLLRRAVDDFRERYGDDHQWTLYNLQFLARGLRDAGHGDEAVAISRQRLERMNRKADEPDASAKDLNAAAWNLLTWDFPELRDPAAALPLAERALAGAADDERAGILDTLALALHENGRTTEAIERQREALALLADAAPRRRSVVAAPLVRYLDAAGHEEQAREAIVAHVRGLRGSSRANDEFVGEIERFSDRLAEHGLSAWSELARSEALALAQKEGDEDPAAVAALSAAGTE